MCQIQNGHFGTATPKPELETSSFSGAFSGPKTRPAAVAEQSGRLTWIFFGMFDERWFDSS